MLAGGGPGRQGDEHPFGVLFKRLLQGAHLLGYHLGPQLLLLLAILAVRPFLAPRRPLGGAFALLHRAGDNQRLFAGEQVGALGKGGREDDHLDARVHVLEHGEGHAVALL